MTLHPSENITKLLLSTTTRFVAEYASESILLTHAWPSGHRQAEGNLGRAENPMSRNYYVLVLKTPPPDPTKQSVTQNIFICKGESNAGNIQILWYSNFNLF